MAGRPLRILVSGAGIAGTTLDVIVLRNLVANLWPLAAAIGCTRRPVKDDA
jgi:hypothetical protein